MFVTLLALTPLFSPEPTEAVVTGTVTAQGQPVPEAVVRLDPETPPPPIEAAHDRARDPSPLPGGIPVVVRTGTNGKFEIEMPTDWGGGLVLSAGHDRNRSPEIAAGRDASVGEITTSPNEQCIRLSVDGGNQWVCEHDRWRYAQPATTVAQATATDVQTRMSAEALTAQWAWNKIGLTARPAGAPLTPVIVAVIDSGLDYAHPYLKPENIWRNPAPGADAAYPGDLIGWNFVTQSNQPWDDYGHGTFVAGLIVTLNPAVRIMPLKVLDKFGGGRVSAISAAVIYAVDHGARVINLSLGSAELSRVEQSAVDYARSRGAVIVVAAGNQGVDTVGFGPAGSRGVVTVAATDRDDKKPPFGNWGQHVALSAPGVDIISLRARGSDLVLATTGGKDYKAGANVIGQDRWLFRATGTSFATSFVAGAASLLFARTPSLTNEQVERMLAESADDIGVPGWDQFTGAGRLNVAKALQADPDYFLIAKIARIGSARQGGQVVVNVFGTARGSGLERYEIQLGQGNAPSSWKTVASEQGRAIEGDLLASFPARELSSKGMWTIRLLVQDAGKRTKESRGTLNVQ